MAADAADAASVVESVVDGELSRHGECAAIPDSMRWVSGPGGVWGQRPDGGGGSRDATRDSVRCDGSVMRQMRRDARRCPTEMAGGGDLLFLSFRFFSVSASPESLNPWEAGNQSAKAKTCKKSMRCKEAKRRQKKCRGGSGREERR
jgi:hypothetical protein